MAFNQELLDYINSLMEPWMQAQNKFKQDQGNQWLSQAVGGVPTSVAAAANSQYKPVGKTSVGTSPVGSKHEITLRGQEGAAIDKFNESNRLNWFQSLLSQMPQFQLPMPDLSGFGRQMAGPEPDRRPMTGSIMGLEGINDWSGNATTDNGMVHSNVPDLMRKVDSPQNHSWNLSQAEPINAAKLDNIKFRADQMRVPQARAESNSSIANMAATMSSNNAYKAAMKGKPSAKLPAKVGKSSYSNTYTKLPTPVKTGGKKK